MKVRKLVSKSVNKSSDIKGLIDDFLRFSEAKGNTQNTINSHRYALNLLCKNDVWRYPAEDLDRKHIQNLLVGISDSYYNKRLSAYKQFFEYCISEGIIDENPAASFKYKRPTVQVVDHAEEDVRRFMNAINQSTFSGLRDYVFCILMLDTGIRPSEALQLCPKDIDKVRKQIHVRAEIAKTGRERYLPASVKVLNALEKLLSYRPDDWKANAPILSTYDGNPLPARGIQKRFRDYAMRTGITITPYHLRHVFGITFIRNGGSPFALQEMLGHEGLEMTKVYVHFNNGDLAKAHEQASPLRNFVGGRRMRNPKMKR